MAKLGKSQRERDADKVASVAVLDRRGRLLFIKRKDNGTYCLPGGRLNPGESPLKAAIRELKEETNLSPIDMEELGQGQASNGLMIYCFKAMCNGEPDASLDPDDEAESFHWVDISNGLPEHIAQNLHSKKNITLGLMSLQDHGLKKTESGIRPTIIMCRHGETAFNAKNKEDDTEKLRGWLDIPLNDTGRQQAAVTAQKLAGLKISHIDCSDLSRTCETAAIIHRQHPEVKLNKNPALRPWDMGELNGKSIKDVIPVMLHYIEHENEKMPGSCETFKEFQIRCLGTIKQHQEEALQHPERGPIVLVAHSRNTRVFEGWILAGCRDVDVINKKPLLEKEEVVEPGHFMVVEWNGAQWVHLRDDDDGGPEKLRFDLRKDEEAPRDEIEELLKSPNPADRTMALKMAGVQPRHLVQAVQDKNINVQNAALAHPMVNDDVLRAAIDTRDAGLVNRAWQHPGVKPHHLEQMYDKALSTPGFRHTTWIESIAEDPRTPPELLKRIWEDTKDITSHDADTVKKLIIQHPNVPEEIVNSPEVIKDDADDVAANPKLSQQNLKKLLIDHHDPYIRRVAANNPNVSSDMITDVLRRGTLGDHDNANVRAGLMSHPNLQPHHIDIALHDKTHDVRHAAFNPSKWALDENAPASPALQPRHVDEALKSGDYHLIREAMSSHASRPEHVEKLMNLKDFSGYTFNGKPISQPETMMSAALSSPQVTSEQLSRALRYPNSSIQGLAVQHPNFQQHHIKEVLSNPDSTKEAFNALRRKHQDKFTSEDWNQAMRNPQSFDTFMHSAVPSSALDVAIAAHPQHHEAILEHPNVTSQQVEHIGASNQDEDVQHTIATHRKATPAILQHIMLYSPDRKLAARTLLNTNSTPEMVEHAIQSGEPAMLANAHRSRAATQDQLRRLYSTPGAASREVPSHPNAPADVIEHAARNLNGHVNHLIVHPNISPETLQYIEQTYPQYKEEVRRALQLHHPDVVHKEAVDVKLNTGKLRKIRDLIRSRGVEEMRPKDLPPGDWSLGRLPNGNISAQKLQQAIDEAPGTRFNLSHARWTGAQRHNEQPSKVLQVNITNDQVQKMKEAGVYGTFRNIHQTSLHSGHPVTPSTLGWIRYTGNAKNGYFIDELQSDLGASLVKQAASQARQKALEEAKEKGLNEEQTTAHVNDFMSRASKNAEQEWPDAHYQKIKNIVFGNAHPSHLLGEAFLQHIRDKGQGNAKVHIHSPDSKAPISGLDKNKPMPAHFMEGYHKWPAKAGLEPTNYGSIKAEDNPEHQGKPVHGGIVRKREE